MKKRLCTLLMTAALVLSGCGASSGSSDKIVIGALGPLTGELAVYGISSTNGTKLAFEEINANGGILGKQVEYRLEDEKGDVREAKNAYGKLVSENIDALIGDITSSTSYVVGEDANNDGVPMITPTGTQLNITKGRPYVFRACFTDPYQGEVLAKYVKDSLKKEKVAIMRNTSSDYSNGVADAFIEKAKKLGIKIVSEVAYGSSDKDFRAQLAKIKETDPELLLIPDYYQTIALIAPQARELGITAQFIGPDGWDGILQQLKGDKEAYKIIDGAIFSSHYSIEDTNDRVKKFVTAYREKFKEDPTAFSALAYDAAYLIKEAIEKAGDTNKEKVKDALKNIDFKGITGNLKFDDDNNPIKEVTIIKIKDGKYTFDSVIGQ